MPKSVHLIAMLMQSSWRSLYLLKMTLQKVGYLQKEMPSRTAFRRGQEKNNTIQKTERKVLEVMIQKMYSFKIF